MNGLLIIVILMFLISGIVGYVRGFIKIAVSLGATAVTIVLVLIATPHIGNAIKTVTPLDEMIQKKCIESMMPDTKEVLPEGMELPQGVIVEDVIKNMDIPELPLKAQIEVLENAKIPDFLRKGLLNSNNSEVYKVLGVTNFFEYIGAYIANMIINILAFLITFLLVTILMRVTIFALDIITKLPVLDGVNRITGSVLGIVGGLVLVWIAFLVITLLYTTSIGTICFEQIQSSKVLTFLYDNNYLLKLIMGP